MSQVLKAPFPYYGGKSKVADLVWERLGDPDNYVEPFSGSAAVLLRRPGIGRTETINDRNHFVVNFWRAVQADPESVARYADHPVTEADLHARHRYLMRGPDADSFREAMATNPYHFNAEFAGWWVWGQCCWIGSGWCTPVAQVKDGSDTKRCLPEMVIGKGVSMQVPDLAGDGGAFGREVCSSAGHNKRPILVLGNSSFLPGVNGEAKMPLLNNWNKNGTGVCEANGRPQLGDAYDIGRGVNGHRESGTCDERRAWLFNWMNRLADRLRLVRVCYGHWDRICDSVTTMTRLGTCGAFLDPPYAKSVERLAAWIAHLSGNGPAPTDEGDSSNRHGGLYSGDADQDIDRLVAEVHLWCRRWGAESNVRIALCGYEGEHDGLEEFGWTVLPWKAHGGYGNRNPENQNKHRERIWFSPACSGAKAQRGLFE